MATLLLAVYPHYGGSDEAPLTATQVRTGLVGHIYCQLVGSIVGTCQSEAPSEGLGFGISTRAYQNSIRVQSSGHVHLRISWWLLDCTAGGEAV